MVLLYKKGIYLYRETISFEDVLILMLQIFLYERKTQSNILMFHSFQVFNPAVKDFS